MFLFHNIITIMPFRELPKKPLYVFAVLCYCYFYGGIRFLSLHCCLCKTVLVLLSSVVVLIAGRKQGKEISGCDYWPYLVGLVEEVVKKGDALFISL